MIKKIMFKIYGWVLLFVIALLPGACSDDDGNDVPEGPAPEVLGTFTFDGTSIPIVTALFSETVTGSNSEGYYTFAFSPQGAGSEITTRLVVSIRKYWGDGEPHEVGGLDLDHNDDYIIIYEDPVHYYSQYREPESGSFTITVPDDRSGQFSVKLDVKLADGTPLSIDYNGTLTVGTEQ